MHAALVSAFDRPPRYAEVPEPVAQGPHELVVEVVAAGLHPRVRSQADGSHYTSTGVLPLVPGVDGVGRDPDGTLRYFVLPDTPQGSLAERTVIDSRRSVVLPSDVDPVAVAAAMNPAMSSWVALRRRITVPDGASVLVLGATGSAGRMAVPIARRLGAAHVVAAGRDRAKLAAMTGVETVSLDDPAAVGRAAAEVDVVLDYVWGAPSAAAIVAVVTARADRSRPLTWVQIGSVAGPEAAIPSAALRAARLQIVGSGQGSVPTADIVAELAALVPEIPGLDVDAVPVALDDVAEAWTSRSGRRIVLVP
ncbi:zinc-binding alcohol dehydrogenase family protein [Pseudonocardia ailaonensis]|uniref:Zinc-binding alcohol dehydrogenase family protein n=1 Tax=Pseudonocardia ailaonensis TaxID=367279 RepID=A0ABN2MSW6_9PSEU